MLICISLDVASMVAKGKDLEVVRFFADSCFDKKDFTSKSHRELLQAILIDINRWKNKPHTLERQLELVRKL